MARYFDVNPDNPQPRSIAQVAEIVRGGGLVAYPTDSSFAFGCSVGNGAGQQRIRRIRQLDDRHHFTLMVAEFAQLGAYVMMDNWEFRAIKAAIPGQYTFILRATRELPRAMLQPKKRTVGVRVPNNVTAQALLAELGAPLLSSTLLLPGHSDPLTDGWTIKDELDHDIDAVLDSGDAGNQVTTVVDFSSGEPVVVRYGAGDPSLFE
ncbi:MAG: L-threonylcarbamoyladenylate synthase [Propionibacteriaceae bacterium]|nr:L-threonylcarbamoyladenylate synthase [Propionibacteriaceae bacterium]